MRIFFKLSPDGTLWYDKILEYDESVSKSYIYFGLKHVKNDKYISVKIIFLWFLLGVIFKNEDSNER